jgi:Uma2 family endonuclease
MTQSTLVTSEALTPDFIAPPGQDDLLSDDGIPMETYRHKLQMDLLVDPLAAWLVNKDAFVGGNMFVYFSPHQLKNHDFRGPDMFAVLDVPPGERKCWVTWEEGKGPDVVVELLSSSTAQRDKTEKKDIYQNRLRVPEYFWYDPFNPDDFAGFMITERGYEPLSLDPENRLVSQKLGLALVRWPGEFGHVTATWLRWSTLEGEILPTAAEKAELAQQQAELAQQQAELAQQQAELARQQAELARQQIEVERQRGDRLAAKLRALGIDPYADR